MEFGPISADTATGAILAHSIRLSDRALKKGHWLTEEDVEALKAAGITSVTVCRLAPDDVPENDAADTLAMAATGDGFSRSAAFTGRVNLIAQQDGILVYDPVLLDALNRVDEGITFAALPPYSRVAARQMVATAKIIPFGVPKQMLQAACPKSPLFRIAAFQSLSLGLIQTILPGVKPSVLDKTDQIMNARAASLGAVQITPVRCKHSEDDLTLALAAMTAEKVAIITIVGASAIVDRRDVIPAAISQCGGTVEHFGMPVDPGNLLLLGRIGDIPVIGAPGCVRSPKPNGYDWVLERLVAGLPVDGPGIMAMGSGGFLKEIPVRPLPRAEAAPKQATSHAPCIIGLMLAAGQSRRMGKANKLLENLDGKPMLRHSLEILLAAQIDGVTVVTGHEAERVRQAISDLPVSFTDSPDYASGLAETVKRGIAALPESADGVLICLGDMPRVKTETLNRLIAAFDPTEGRTICVPVHLGKRGNPVLFGRRFFAEIMDLSGDTGAKSLIGAYEEQVAEIVVDDPGVLLDLDTPDALRMAQNR
ncbi:MAG: molybdopterin-binding/glycosyltransferase family 2 protein [Alphaproteobacteria bacterium]|nr:molybdopterin-binding/glycosyltransferase family 2 protein [Alphaproteobacteria bacterium]